jgi:hypothetical protein
MILVIGPALFREMENHVSNYNSEQHLSKITFATKSLINVVSFFSNVFLLFKDENKCM